MSQISPYTSPNDAQKATYTASRIHGRLSLFQEETRIQLNHVRMVIQRSKNIRNLRVWINIFHSLMTLQPKEVTELVQRGNLPLARLQDTQNLNNTKRFGNHLCSEKSSRLFDALLEFFDHFGVVELAVCTALEAGEGADLWIIWDASLVFQKTGKEFLWIELGEGLVEALEHLLAQECLEPFLVAFGDDGMEAVEEVEFGGNLVAHTAIQGKHDLFVKERFGVLPRRAIAGEVLVDCNTRIQSPVRVRMMSIRQTSEVIVEGNIDVETAHDTENIFVSAFWGP